jgi:ribose transport system substrate-binding protein
MKYKNAMRFAGLAVAACSVFGAASYAQDAGAGKVGVNYSILTSPFWTAYDRYIHQYSKELDAPILAPVNSQQDSTRQITDIQNLINIGARALIISPIDSAAIQPSLNQAAKKGIAVITVDVAPDKGPVTMVVRADNRAYGDKACHYIGDHVKEGKVVQIMGDLVSVNGRDRTVSFRDCMKSNYPKIQVLEIPAKWKAELAASGLDSLLPANPDLKAIYMQAGGVFQTATIQALKRHAMLFPAGDPKHIVVVSNDGIPQEFDAIRNGEIDATVSQPADLYAKYGLAYAKDAMAGKKFAVGPTDHDSKIVELSPGVLEDELPAPLVTKENVDDKSLWGNTL